MLLGPAFPTISDSRTHWNHFQHCLANFHSVDSTCPIVPARTWIFTAPGVKRLQREEISSASQSRFNGTCFSLKKKNFYSMLLPWNSRNPRGTNGLIPSFSQLTLCGTLLVQLQTTITPAISRFLARTPFEDPAISSALFISDEKHNNQRKQDPADKAALRS